VLINTRVLTRCLEFLQIPEIKDVIDETETTIEEESNRSSSSSRASGNGTFKGGSSRVSTFKGS